MKYVWRAKLRAGYKIGNGLAYATSGYAQAETSTLGSDGGYSIGAGYEQFVGQGVSVGDEVLCHAFDSFKSTPINVEATTVQIR